MDNFGRTFKGSVGSRWFAMGVIIIVVFGLVIFFQKRKDVVYGMLEAIAAQRAHH